MREDGRVAYTWSYADIDSRATPGCEVFLIAHDADVEHRYTELDDPASHSNGAIGMYGLTLAVPDADSAATSWTRNLGLSYAQSSPAMSSSVRTVRLTLGNYYLDFVTPTGPGPLTGFLDQNGPALYRLTVRVCSLESTLVKLRQRNVSVSRLTDMECIVHIAAGANLLLREN